eukprot:2484691-Pleurochrysis_carterae.AAC.2
MASAMVRRAPSAATIRDADSSNAASVARACAPSSAAHTSSHIEQESTTLSSQTGDEPFALNDTREVRPVRENAFDATVDRSAGRPVLPPNHRRAKRLHRVPCANFFERLLTATTKAD